MHSWTWRDVWGPTREGFLKSARLANEKDEPIVQAWFNTARADLEIAEEHMHLIAAAPDLLHAARQALGTLEWAEKNVSGTNLQSDIILLRRAVSMAEGTGNGSSR